MSIEGHRMWGNWLGWAISAAMSLAAVWIGYQVYAVGQPTLATGWVAATIRPPALADPAAKLLPPLDDTRTDAVQLMRDAAGDYGRHQATYDRWQKAKGWDRAAADALPGFADLVKAASCPRADVFASDPKEVLGYGGAVDLLDNLNGLAKDVQMAAANAKAAGDLPTAKAYGDALLAAGLHLYQERLTLDELTVGQDLMSVGAAVLKRVAQAEPNSADAAAAAAFTDQLNAEETTVTRPAQAVLRGWYKVEVFGPHAADFVQLARDTSADRMWRVEAVRALGRVKRNALKSADNRRAEQVVNEMAKDPAVDPMVRRAAEAADQITEHDYQGSR